MEERERVVKEVVEVGQKMKERVRTPGALSRGHLDCLAMEEVEEEQQDEEEQAASLQLDLTQICSPNFLAMVTCGPLALAVEEELVAELD